MDVNYVKEYFNAQHEKEEHRNHQNKYSKFTFDLHLNYLRPYLESGGYTILDAGCGAGDYAKELLNWGNDVYLVDLSERLIMSAVTSIENMNLKGSLLDYSVGDICNLECLDDESIDCVICMGGVLNYMTEDIGKALMEFRRVLKSNGILITSVGSKLGAIKSMLGNNAEVSSFIVKQIINDNLCEKGILNCKFSDAPSRKLYSSKEFNDLLLEFSLIPIEKRAIPSITSFMYPLIYHVQQKRTYQLLINLEEQTSNDAGLLDSGDFYMFIARKE